MGRAAVGVLATAVVSLSGGAARADGSCGVGGEAGTFTSPWDPSEYHLYVPEQ